MKHILRDHGLTLVALSLFLVSWAGQVLTGRLDYNADQREHGQPQVTLLEYLQTGHFGEGTLENWESEFLQIGLFVFLTSLLVQRGAADSHKPKGDPGAGQESVMEDPARHRRDPKAPWPVRRGGLALALYRNSLSITFGLLFLAAFWGHAVTGAAEHSQAQLAHGQPALGTVQYIATAHFWYQSFQNWQSEFLAVLSLTVLSIWLRQHGSTQSKPVHAPHSQTGSE